jgi:hypothetical protein
MSSSDRHRELLRSLQAPASALDYEIAQEMASALGRLGRALEHALRALSDFDADAGRQSAPDARAVRRALVDAAGGALWNFIVQREACGMRDAHQVLQDYRVPAELRGRVGIPDPPLRRRAVRG